LFKQGKPPICTSNLWFSPQVLNGAELLSSAPFFDATSALHEVGLENEPG